MIRPTSSKTMSRARKTPSQRLRNDQCQLLLMKVTPGGWLPRLL
jgi:hypothetical protein